MRLLLTAYWVEQDVDLSEVPLLEPYIKGAGAVVAFTPEQVDQPGLRQVLRRLQLEEAADFDPEQERA